MGVKVSNDVFSEKTHRICAPKFMCTPAKGLYIKVIKRIVQLYELLNFWRFWGHLTW